MRPSILPLALILIASGAHGQDNWPDYRGPTMDGHATAKGLPLQWSEQANVKWKTPIHDRGWSSPVVWGKQIWLTTATEDGRKMYVLCVDRDTGKILLDRLLFENPNPDGINDLNSYASPTPAIEEGRVYLHFGNYGTVCLNTKTFEKVWERRNLPAKFSVGPGSSPILYKGLLILTMDGIDKQYVAALNGKTGETVWKTDRTTDWSQLDGGGRGDSEEKKAFVTPIIATIQGKPQLISTGAQSAYSYDPLTGKELWRVHFRGYSQSSRPLVGDGIVYINTGFNRAALLAFKAEGSGDLTNANLLWKCVRNAPTKPSALLIDGALYLVDDSGVVSCLDAKTGGQIWKERIGGGEYSASPVLVDGRIYCFSHEGTVTVLAASRTYQSLAQFKMKDGMMASPAISGKAFFLRTKSALYRIEGK